jgi:hypothetical protein
MDNREVRAIAYDMDSFFYGEYEYFTEHEEYQVSLITERAADPIIFFIAESSWERVVVTLIK